MPKITRDDIIGPTGLGFTKELYSVIAPDIVAFDVLVDAVISEQAAELAERVGSSVYNDAARLNYVKKAEKCLAAAEMVQRRINIVLGTRGGLGEPSDTRSEQQQRKDYLDQAEIWISKLAQGITVDPPSDFAVRVITSSRFETTS